MRIPVLLSLGLLMLQTGCRTYGGHGTEAAAQAEIINAVERYSTRADRMKGDQRALAEAAANSPGLATFAPELARIIRAQEATQAYNQETAIRVEDNASYRTLHRALGSIITEQQIIDDQYGRLLGQVHATVRSGLSKSPSSHYSLAPVFYARIEASIEHLSIRETLR